MSKVSHQQREAHPHGAPDRLRRRLGVDAGRSGPAQPSRRPIDNSFGITVQQAADDPHPGRAVLRLIGDEVQVRLGHHRHQIPGGNRPVGLHDLARPSLGRLGHRVAVGADHRIQERFLGPEVVVHRCRSQPRLTVHGADRDSVDALLGEQLECRGKKQLATVDPGTTSHGGSLAPRCHLIESIDPRASHSDDVARPGQPAYIVGHRINHLIDSFRVELRSDI